jgi:hypothetical protein
VDGGNPVGKLRQQVEQRRRREAAALPGNEGFEVRPVHPLEDEKRRFGFGAPALQPYDARVIEGRKDLGLVTDGIGSRPAFDEEPLAGLRIGRHQPRSGRWGAALAFDPISVGKGAGRRSARGVAVVLAGRATMALSRNRHWR